MMKHLDGIVGWKPTARDSAPAWWAGVLGATRVASGTRRACGEFSVDDGHDASSQNFDRSQHLPMRERRDAHLECNSRDAPEGIIHVQYFLRDRFGVADQQRTCGSAYLTHPTTG